MAVPSAVYSSSTKPAAARSTLRPGNEADAVAGGQRTGEGRRGTVGAVDGWPRHRPRPSRQSWRRVVIRRAAAERGDGQRGQRQDQCRRGACARHGRPRDSPRCGRSSAAPRRASRAVEPRFNPPDERSSAPRAVSRRPLQPKGTNTVSVNVARSLDAMPRSDRVHRRSPMTSDRWIGAGRATGSPVGGRLARGDGGARRAGRTRRHAGVAGARLDRQRHGLGQRDGIRSNRTRTASPGWLTRPRSASVAGRRCRR